MTRSIRIAFATLGLFAAAGLGCGGDGGGATGPSASDLIGAWEAVQVEMVSSEDPSHKMDMLGTSTLTLWFKDDQTWDGYQTYQVGPPISTHGTWSLSGRTLTITPDGGFALNYKVSCDGSSMTLSRTTTWDHDMDGINEPATLTMEFVK